jgi:hypothetical protein
MAAPSAQACDPWNCKCGSKNNIVDICGECKTFKSKGRIRRQAGPQRREDTNQPRDWMCTACHSPSPNFARRQTCRKCGAPRDQIETPNGQVAAIQSPSPPPRQTVLCGICNAKTKDCMFYTMRVGHPICTPCADQYYRHTCKHGRKAPFAYYKKDDCSRDGFDTCWFAPCRHDSCKADCWKCS